MASDRSIGGFAHTWGEDQPKVQKKRRLLEQEGIVFEDKGNSSKIRYDFFVEPATTTESATKTKSSTSLKGSKKQKMEEPQSKPAATKKHKSKYFDTSSVSEETLKEEILNLLQKRQTGKTC